MHKDMTDEELLALWSDTMRELMERGVIRTRNSPTGDIGESLAAATLGLSLAVNSKASYDGTDSSGRKYQIKTRRLPPNKAHAQLSTIRNLGLGGFDDLVIVFLEDDFSLRGMWCVPIDVVRERSTYRDHENGHTLITNDALFADPRVRKIKPGTSNDAAANAGEER